jgi:hypothetical protein
VVAQVGLLADLKPYGSGKKNFSFPKPTESLLDKVKLEVWAFDVLWICQLIDVSAGAQESVRLGLLTGLCLSALSLLADAKLVPKFLS